MSEILAIDNFYAKKIESILAMRDSGVKIEAAARGGEFNKAGNVAIIPVRGMMMKGFGFDGLATDTIGLKNKLRAADKNDAVSGIFMIVDSPGGDTAGMASLIDTLNDIKKRKPIHAAIDDIGGSAAYWLASQADTVSVSRTGATGSIGVFTVLHDTSEALEKAGIKTHIISSGDLKGSGEGVPISDERIAEIQKRVDFFADAFIKEVSTGRGIPIESVEKLATGAVFTPKEAKRNGLVDTIADVETALNNFKATLDGPNRGARIRRKLKITKHRRNSV
jgi:signal peptide peptidase SppA